MKPKINYDPKVNILSIKLSNKKSIDSDVQKNIVLDYAKDGNVTNIEIMGVNIDEFADLNLISQYQMRQSVSVLRDKNK